MSESSNSGGCGCFSIAVTILVLSPLIVITVILALWFGLPTPWGTFNIDIFPPAIRQIQ